MLRDELIVAQLRIVPQHARDLFGLPLGESFMVIEAPVAAEQALAGQYIVDAGDTPLEAIGYGTPALISKQSGVSEVLTNCLKVDYWDLDEMANQIVAVVQNDALRDELYVNARKEYDRLSWDQSADKLMGLYHHHREVAPA